MTELNADELTKRAEKINVILAKCNRAASEALFLMLEAGRELQEMSEQMPHGDYEAWVRANCRVSPRMARLYRQAYRRSRELSLKPEIVSGLRTLRDLLRYCDANAVAGKFTLSFVSSEQRGAFFAALKRHYGATSDPVPFLIQALNAMPVQRKVLGDYWGTDWKEVLSNSDAEPASATTPVGVETSV